jgi:hypothetical protein
LFAGWAGRRSCNTGHGHTTNLARAEDVMDLPLWYLQCCIAALALALYFAQEID